MAAPLTMSDTESKYRHFPVFSFMSRPSRRKDRVKIIPTLDDRLCSPCKKLMSEVLYGVHKEATWSRDWPFRDRAISRLDFQEGRSLSGNSQTKCTICLLIADCLERQASDRANGMITINRKQNRTQFRATFSIKCCATNEHSEFRIYHDLAAWGPRAFDPIDSKSAYQFIQSCAWACSNHAGCQRTTSSLPTRVVDVASTDGNSVAIYESRGAVASYLALSHCWGGEITSRTNNENLRDRQQSMRIDSLAKNFQDAIHITRKLGFRYIWIDALCIIQDDEEDWMREAASMYEIYHNALLVISASSSRHSETGMLFQRSACVSKNFSLSAQGFEDLQLIHSPLYKLSFDEDAALNRRCWALQERVAARAVVHIGFGAILWECRTMSQWEDESPQTSHPILKSMDPHLTLIGHTMENKNIDLWCTVVSIYTSRHLTLRKDKFSAIAGIAKMFEDQELMKGRYLAGLWEGSIYAQLLWYTRKPASARAFDLSPSWSWASVDCPVGWFPRTMPDFEPIDEDSCIFDSEGTRVEEATKAAHCQTGRIALSGAIADARLEDLRLAFCRDIRFPWWIAHHPRFLDNRSKSTSDDHFNQWVIFDGPSYAEFSVLRLCSLRFLSGTANAKEDHSISYYLLLEHVPPDGKTLDQFRRIGIMQVPRRWVSQSRSVTKAITII